MKHLVSALISLFFVTDKDRVAAGRGNNILWAVAGYEVARRPMANFCRACGAAWTPCAKIVAGLVLGGVLLLASWSDNPPGLTSAAAEGGPAGATPALRNVGSISANRWQRYINTRYGVMIDYPADLFAIEPPPPAGRGFVSEELQDEDVLDIGDKAAAKQGGKDWYQVVAGKDGDVILRRVLLRSALSKIKDERLPEAPYYGGLQGEQGCRERAARSQPEKCAASVQSCCVMPPSLSLSRCCPPAEHPPMP